MSITRPCIPPPSQQIAGWCSVDCSSGEPVMSSILQETDPGGDTVRCSYDGTFTHVCELSCVAGDPEVVVVPEPPLFDGLLAGALMLAALSMWC